AIGSIEPAVEPQFEAIDPMLRVALSEAREKHVAMIRAAVAIAILGVEDIRGARDQHTITPGDDPRGQTEAIDERRRLVVPAVSLGILEEPDPAPRLSAPVRAERIVPHLDDP